MRWRRPTIVALCQSSQALILGGVALFLPLIREDLGLTFTEAGALVATSTLLYAVMQIPSGFLADRYGPRRLFIIGLAGVNVLAVVFALLDAYWAVLANQALSGVFRALVFAPGLLLMSALFPPGRRATAMGFYVVGGLSSNVLLNLVGPHVVEPLGWRAVFVVFGALGAVALAVLWRTVPEPAGAPPDPPSLREAGRLLREGMMWLLGVLQYVRLAIVFGLATWLPTLLVEDKGLSLGTAGLMVAIVAAATAPANFLGGYLSDRSGRPLVIIGWALAAAAVSLVALVHAQGVVALAVAATAATMAAQLCFGPMFSVPIEVFGSRTAGASSGISNFFANLGAFTFIAALGPIKDATGAFDAGLYALGGAAVTGLACTVALARRLSSSRVVAA